MARMTGRKSADRIYGVLARKTDPIPHLAVGLVRDMYMLTYRFIYTYIEAQLDRPTKLLFDMSWLQQIRSICQNNPGIDIALEASIRYICTLYMEARFCGSVNTNSSTMIVVHPPT